VASSPDKRAVARAAGADEVVGVDDFVATVAELTGGRGVDLVADPVGGDRFEDSLRCLADEGRLLVVGFAAGSIPSVRVNRLLLRNLVVIGVNWGRHAFADPTAAAREWSRLQPHVVAGRLVAPVAEIHPLAEVTMALRRLDERTATGKLLLRVRP
jgi:NADPH2:quinone reductase